jgi:hypothetical protein
MALNMTKKAVLGCKFYVYSRVLFVSNEKFRGIVVALNSLLGFDVKMIKILLKEVKSRLKHRLRSMFVNQIPNR